MKPKIILHCGAQGTGSTGFQSLLDTNASLPARAGFYSAPASGRRRNGRDIRVMLDAILRPGNDNQTFIHRIRGVLADIHSSSGAHTLIISGESILGKPFSARSPHFYERAEQTAERIRLTLDDYDVEVRFVIRDYAEFLANWYVQSVRLGSALTFGDYLRVHDFDSVSWKTPVRALRKYFGPAKVGVFEHDDLLRDSEASLIAMFPDVMAVLGDHGPLPAENPVHLGIGMLEVYRRWNEISARVMPDSVLRRTIQQFGRRYGLKPFERFSKPEKVMLPSLLAEQLSARYRADVAMINPRRVFFDEVDALRHAAQ